MGSCLSARNVRVAPFTLKFIAVTAPALAALVVLASLGGCTGRKKQVTPNTLNLSSIAKISTLDPAMVNDLYSGLETGRVYEGLLQYHYLKRPFQLIPNLAEAMPEVSRDSRTFTFKIKKGVLFQDDASFTATQGKGRELEASDFVYSFKRLADPKLPSPNWGFLQDKIAGLDAWREAGKKAGKADYAAEIPGLRALDRYTLQITLNKPSHQFVYYLAMPGTAVVPREAVEKYGDEFRRHPVGTGPFKLSEYNPASRVIWVRNPTYRRELYPSEGGPGDAEKGLLADAGKPLPLVDRLVMTVHEESQPLWLNFMQGNLDAVTIPKDNFAASVVGKELTPELKSKGIRLDIYPLIDITFIAFNMTDPVIGKNKWLRQAINLAYDEIPYIETFYNGRAIPAQGPIPPGLRGHDPEFKNPYRQFSLEKAKAALAKAGYPDGKGLAPLTFLSPADSQSRQSFEYLSKALLAIGVKVEHKTGSWPEFQASIRNKRGHFWGMAWGADYPDGENFLQLFYSKNAAVGNNDSGYSNPVYDQLFEEALALEDGPKRTALYRKMTGILVEDCPWIFGVHRLGYAVINPWLKNFKYHDLDHGKGKYLRVDDSLRK